MNIPYNSPALDAALSSLANQKRRGIIHDLSLQPATVSQLATNHNLTLPAIHKHIRDLENSQLIARKKVGRTNFVAINPNTLSLIQNWIMQYQTGWSNADATLENYVSRMNE